MQVSLARAAWSSAVAHVVALAVAGVVLGPVLDAREPAARAARIAAQPGAWILGWAAWAIAGLTLIGFLVAARRALAGRALAVALGLGIAGLTLELAGHAIWSVPVVAAAERGDPDAVARLGDLARWIGAVVPQPVFGASVLLVGRAARRAGGSRAVSVAAGVNVVAALAMAGASAIDHPLLVPVMTAAVVLSLATLQVAVARSARLAKPPPEIGSARMP